MSFAAAAVGIGSAVAGAAVSSALAPSGGGASGAAAAADPFASQRPQYQQMLQAMMTGKNADGSDYSFQSSDPSYQFRLNQGMTATDRQLAANGFLNSGNRMTALEDYAQGTASAEYSNQFSRLAQLAGANVGSPAAAGQIMYSGAQQQQAGASAIGNAVGNAVQQGSGYFFNGSTPANGTGTTYGGTGSVTPYNFSSGVSDPSAGVSYSAFGYGG